jgi:hypothetical protein
MVPTTSLVSTVLATVLTGHPIQHVFCLMDGELPVVVSSVLLSSFQGDQ